MSPAAGGSSVWRRLAIVLALAVVAGPAGQVWAAAPRVLPDGAVPQDRRLEQPKDYDGYFPFEPPQTAAAWAERREGQTADPRGDRPLAHAGPHPRQRGRSRADRSGRLHGRESLSAKFPRPFRDRQSLPPQGEDGPAARNLVSARTLARRAVLRRGSGRNPQADRPGRRAIRRRRPLAVAIALRATGPDGRGRVSLRHAGLCRQRADPV